MTIHGDLDLTALRTVAGPFQCRNCHFDGSLAGRDVTFKNSVDLRGLVVDGDIDLAGARFEGPTLLGSVGRERGDAPCSTKGLIRGWLKKRSDLSLASFENYASFQGVHFGGRSSFRLARFSATTVFAGAVFHRPATFDEAGVSGTGRFDSATFCAMPSFDRATFTADVDFRDAWFFTRASFNQAEFKRGSEFGHAVFEGEAVFARSRFDGFGSFAGARFENTQAEAVAASFERASAERLDFSDASFGTAAVFSGVAASVLSFDGTSFAITSADPASPGLGSVFLDGLAVDELDLDVTDVDHVNADDRIGVLELVERSAKARGDIGRANDAHYQLHVLSSRQHGWFRRTADLIFYRGIAGYFVRPLHPLAAAVALAATLAVWREVRASFPQRRLRRRSAARWTMLSSAPALRILSRIFDSAIALRRGPSADAPDAAALPRRLEVLTYRVLIVCALIGLANSNPTLRQMFDALL